MKLFSFILVFTILPFMESYDNLPKFAQKKVDKTLSELFPDQEVIKTKLTFNSEDKSVVDFDIDSSGELYLLKVDEEERGYAYFSKAPSKFLLFDYVVFFDNSLQIMRSNVLVYREDYGGEIAARRWLKQFDGKTNGQNMEFEKDIDTVSGATISCQSMTYGVKKLSKQIYQLKQKGLI